MASFVAYLTNGILRTFVVFGVHFGVVSAATLSFSACTVRSFDSVRASVGQAKPLRQEFVLRGGVPLLFVACDNSQLQKGQAGCQPLGSRQGDLHFYDLAGRNAGEGALKLSGVVVARSDLLAAPSGKSAQRNCKEVLAQIQGGGDNLGLKVEGEVSVESLTCQVEINTRLGGELTVSIIPLGESWKLPADAREFKKRFLSLNPWVGRDPSSLKIKTNVSLLPALGQSQLAPTDGEVLYFLLDLQKTLNAPWGQVEGCLKNSRAVNQMDLQHHTYCQLPKDPYRQCLGSRISAYKADPLCQGKAANVAEAVDFCFKQSNLQNSKGETADYFRSQPWRYEMFKEVFLVSNGLKDFDLEKQNAVLDRFYKEIGKERPRKINDSFPAWSLNHPRYIEQWDNQIKGSGKLPAAPSVCEHMPKVEGESFE